MEELKALLCDIERLRKNLYRLIDEKGANLQDPDIISASELLNAAISKYNEIVLKKLNKTNT